MDLELSAEQVTLRDTVRRLLADHAPIGVAARGVADGATWAPDRAWSELVALGAMELLLPGSASGVVDAAIVAEELGRVCYPGPWAPSAAAARALALADVGEIDPATPRSLAAGRRQGSPSHRRTVGGARAEVVLVARAGRLLAIEGPLPAEDEFDPTMPLSAVPDDADGVDVGVLDAAAAARVDDVLVVLLGADALGAASAAMDCAVEYAKARHQFGQPIGAFQAVAHLCVDMLETVELVRGSVLHAAWALDADDADAARAALRVRASAERLLAVAETAIQVLGGIGYTWEHDAHLWLKRLMTWASIAAPAAARQDLARLLAR